MKAKTFLNQLEKIDRLIENKKAEVQHWKDIALITSPQSTSVLVKNNGKEEWQYMEKVQSTSNLHKMEDAIIEYIDREAEIIEEINRLATQKKKIISTIERLNWMEYDLLHKVYVQKLTLQEAADTEGKSYSWATTVHGRALASLQKIIDNAEI